MDLNEDSLKEINIEGSHYCVAGKKGRRDVMEDTVLPLKFMGFQPGRRAADFAAENLGENIVDAMLNLEEQDSHIEQAVRAGYLKTDEAFLNQGGYVDCHNGVWRIQRITSDWDFLIMASDGLWEEVNNQEAVDLARSFCVEKNKFGSMHADSNSMAACRKLVELAGSRGTKDYVTVIIVDLRHFGK
eukprot:Gb_36876 [translate_table: standard]